MEHHQTVERLPERRPHVDGHLFGVRLLIFIVKFLFKNSIKSSKFPFSMNFTNPLRRTISPQIYPKITKTFSKQPETWICEVSVEIWYCLKRERDILMNSHHNTAFRCTPALIRPFGLIIGSRLYCSYVSPSCLSSLPSLPSFLLVAFKVSLKKKSTNTSGK